ncbi:MAG: acetolactate synthase small subunit [Candidatus Altarchaeaceae archaeon]
MAIVAAIVEHKPGVLQRVAGLFTRRGFNIEEISVGVTENVKLARMTIVTKGNEAETEQIVKQLNKLVEVVKVSVIDEKSSVSRILCLIKVHTSTKEAKSEFIQYVNVFRGRIVDVSKDTLTAEITGDRDKIDAFINLARGFGIKEIAQTGTTAMKREGI